MKGPAHRQRCVLALTMAAAVASGAWAQPRPREATPELLATLSQVRARGCDGHPGAATPLRRVPALDEAARRIADGSTARDALRGAGYRAKTLFQANMSGYRSAGALAQTAGRQYCKPLTDPRLTDAGFHAQGNAHWILLAEPFNPPSPSDAAAVRERVLALTNEARAQPRECGGKPFRAAAPVAAHPLLERAAAMHAEDMARRGFFRHEGSDGSQAADRVTRAGYRWRAVGENLAAGQTSAQQVVREWLASPEHCATLMDPGFSQMGLAYAVNMNSDAGVYWTQVFGTPR